MRESEYDANGWLASLPPSEGYGLRDGPPEGYRLPTWREQLLGECEAHGPLLALLIGLCAVLVVALVFSRLRPPAASEPAPAECVKPAVRVMT